MSEVEEVEEVEEEEALSPAHGEEATATEDAKPDATSGQATGSGVAAADGDSGNDGDEGTTEDGEDETVDPEAALKQAQAEAAENYDRYLRAAAELENFRKRTLKIRSETREETVRDLLLQVAPLLDNMRRALAQETEDADAVKQGVELIVNQFQTILKGYGLEEIEARGKPFDPNLHEAMMEVADDEHPPGTVLEEMEKGYTLRDKIVLPARVVVSKASEAEPKDGESE